MVQKLRNSTGMSFFASSQPLLDALSALSLRSHLSLSCGSYLPR